jgi:hypothetical protein
MQKAPDNADALGSLEVMGLAYFLYSSQLLDSSFFMPSS